MYYIYCSTIIGIISNKAQINSIKEFEYYIKEVVLILYYS